MVTECGKEGCLPELPIGNSRGSLLRPVAPIAAADRGMSVE